MTPRTYSIADQMFYLIELTVFASALFGAGYVLLGSNRPKDQPNKWYGWVFYALAYALIGVMAMMVSYYE